LAIWLLSRTDKSLSNHGLLCICRIKSSLLHHNIVGSLVLLSELLCWHRHSLIDNCTKQRDVSASIDSNSLNESPVSNRVKEFLEIF
jgi:hypothetical protein